MRQVYSDLLAAWNRRSAPDMAALVTDDVTMIGFDGSQMEGREVVEQTLAGIFADHATATYVGKVRVVRFPTSDVGVLHAVVGMVPRGQTELKPDVNAIQTMVAVKASEKWLITLFQNTPAAFHGRPDLSQQLTGELREVMRASQGV